MARTCDVVVVGAGLSGLACAQHLASAGLDVHVLESGDDVGGRVRTDRVQGFTCDRGFQILNTAYPEARRVLDLDHLDLRPFDRAVELQVEGRRVRLADPLREPSAVVSTLTAPIGSVRDKAALLGYAGVTGAAPAAVLRRRADVPASAAWRSAGIGDTAIDRLLRPFFAGVLLEEQMTTSRRFVDLLTRMFVRGRAAVPARGMQAMAEQLAGRLAPGSVHLGSGVHAVSATGADTLEQAWSARAVVVATDGATAERLLPGVVRAPAWKGVTTVYHAAPEPPLDRASLVVDADDSPVGNTVVMTAAAPEYSADGRALVATSLVPGADAEADEAQVRRRLARVYACDTDSWERVAAYRVPRALPAMAAPHPMQRPVRLGVPPGAVYVCGDHRDTASIQGALVSGRRASQAVLSDLGVGAPTGDAAGS